MTLRVFVAGLALAIAGLASANAQIPERTADNSRQEMEVEPQDGRIAAWDSGAEDIRKVTAGASDLTLLKSFHGLQPTFRAVIRNGSRHDYAVLRWKAELFLDGAATPAATNELYDSYKSDGGLKAGTSKVRFFTVGFVTGEAAWITLEVQSARKRVVKLTVLPEAAQDFSERTILGPRPVAAANPLHSLIVSQHRSADPESGSNLLQTLGSLLPFGMLTCILIVLAHRYAGIAKKRKRNYNWYIGEFPAVLQGGRIHCHNCRSSRIVIQRLMNRTFLRAHVCAQCGTTLYHSQE